MADDTPGVILTADRENTLIDGIAAIAKASQLHAAALIEAGQALNGLMDHIRDQATGFVRTVH